MNQCGGIRKMGNSPSSVSRRTALAFSALTLAGGTIGARLHDAAAQDATPSPDGVELLFIQTFASSSLAPHPTAPDLLILTLEMGTGHTLYFSDRPNRVAGTIPTERFIQVFSQETAGDSANAALVAQRDPDTEVTHVFELLALKYDAQSGVATYSVRFLSDPGQMKIEFAETPQQSLPEAVLYGVSELFIDSGGMMQLVAYGAQDIYEVQDTASPAASG